MAHIVTIDVQIKNLDALKSACKRLGLEFHDDWTAFRSYGNDENPCQYVIEVPRPEYVPSEMVDPYEDPFEVGVCLTGNETYELRYDQSCSGYGLESVIGRNAGLLKQAYALEAARIEAQQRGFQMSEKTNQDGTVVLSLQKEGL